MRGLRIMGVETREFARRIDDDIGGVLEGAVMYPEDAPGSSESYTPVFIEPGWLSSGRRYWKPATQLASNRDEDGQGFVTVIFGCRRYSIEPMEDLYKKHPCRGEEKRLHRLGRFYVDHGHDLVNEFCNRFDVSPVLAEEDTYAADTAAALDELYATAADENIELGDTAAGLGFSRGGWKLLTMADSDLPGDVELGPAAVMNTFVPHRVTAMLEERGELPADVQLRSTVLPGYGEQDTYFAPPDVNTKLVLPHLDFSGEPVTVDGGHLSLLSVGGEHGRFYDDYWDLLGNPTIPPREQEEQAYQQIRDWYQEHL